jgi:hypothetical protein
LTQQLEEAGLVMPTPVIPPNFAVYPGVKEPPPATKSKEEIKREKQREYQRRYNEKKKAGKAATGKQPGRPSAEKLVEKQEARSKVVEERVAREQEVVASSLVPFQALVLRDTIAALS